MLSRRFIPPIIRKDGGGIFRDELMEYFKVDPVECFAFPCGKRQFTTVSSIESLQRSGQRDGDKRDNREKASGLHCRAVLRVL